VRSPLKAPWFVDLLNLNLENHDLAVARRRIPLYLETLAHDGRRVDANLDFVAP
jgi:malate synthase